MRPESRWPDRVICAADEALRALTATATSTRPSPASAGDGAELGVADRAASTALMRVNHAGEIAAQALYTGQAIFARSETTRTQLLKAGREERDHLAWCRERLDELGGRPSLLTPVWYAGAFALGLLAGAAGDRVSLGVIAETEKQVEAHLRDHLERLPRNDKKSAAILERMTADEAHHGTTAALAGGIELPRGVRSVMRGGGEILRRVAAKV